GGHPEPGALAETGGTDVGPGDRHERVDRGPVGVWLEHLEAERAGEVGDDGSGGGDHLGGHLGDRGVGGGDDEEVDAHRRRGEVVAAPQRRVDLPADGGEGEGDGSPGPTGPDDADDPAGHGSASTRSTTSWGSTRQSRSARSGASSRSGTCTNRRSSMRGWGTSRSGSSTTTPSIQSTSTSRVRGPHRSRRTRSAAVSR